MERRGSFDYIMLETSGLADPGNLAPLFWVDDGLGSSIYLDGIVTLVDAKNISLSLDEKPAEIEGHEDGHGGPHLTIAHLQISHADVIVINKCDSVSPQELANVTERIHSINGLAKIHQTQYSQVPKLESFLLDLHAYDGIDSLDTASQGHSHLDPVNTRLPWQTEIRGKPLDMIADSYVSSDNINNNPPSPAPDTRSTHIPPNLAALPPLGTHPSPFISSHGH